MRFLKNCFFVLVFLTLACEPQFFEVPIPYVPVNIEIDINNPQFSTLNTNNYAYLNSEGVRGIIIYKKSRNQYIAFERNCSYTPNQACATVDVHSSGLYMIDTCCSSIFDFNGDPIGGPAISPLLRYNTSLNGNFLRIYND